MHTEGQPLRYYKGSSTGFTQEVEVHYCPNNIWNEISLTYNSFPTTCMSEIMSGYPTDMTTINGTSWFSWDITEDIKKSLGGKITEVLVSSQRDEGHVSLYFFSKECDNHCENTNICASKFPKLEITYTIR